MSILLEHKGQRPKIHPSAYVAPNATICGDVTLGEGCRVLFGATLVAEGNPVVLGKHCIVEENALVKATSRHAVTIGDSVVIGVGAHLAGCTIEENSFFGSGACVFEGAHIGSGTLVRQQAIVHIATRLAPGSDLMIGWVAIGDPAALLPPGTEPERYRERLRKIDFLKTVFGLEKDPARSPVARICETYGKRLGEHASDRPVERQ